MKNSTRALSKTAQDTLNSNSFPEFYIGDQAYKGVSPQFYNYQGAIIKVKKGVPFVRASLKPRERKAQEISDQIGLGNDIEKAISERIDQDI